MYLNRVEIISIDPCMADSSNIRIRAAFGRDVSEVMPYLNTVHASGIYNRTLPSLTYTDGPKLITIFPEELYIGKMKNQTEAYKTLEQVKTWINAVYAQKDELEPTHRLKKRPSAVEVYALLPQENCRECGEKTCLAFAARLLMGQHSLAGCRPLHGEDFTNQKSALQAILQPEC